MVIVNLIGGLGNQMFQYALGRSLSIKNDDELYVDISGFSDYGLRNYSLSDFNCITNIASEDLVRPFLENRKRRHGLRKITYPISRYKKYRFIKESAFEYQPYIMDLSGDLYFKGYWQSEKYFNSIREVLLGDFSLRDNPGCVYFSMLEEIESSRSSVSIHVRRGDYVTNPDAAQVHGVCSMSYYIRAVNYLKERFSGLRYFVFTDEPEWVARNFGFLGDYTLVSEKGDLSDCQELLLMSMCRFNVIANSSFSWWGAWLNDNSDRLVLSPQRWFLDDSLCTKNLIPDAWVRLPMSDNRQKYQV